MIRTGADRLCDDAAHLLAGRHWALVCHAASVDGHLRYVFDRLCADPRTRPTMLLAPEHGLFGERLYMESVPDALDPFLGLPVVSLYGDDADSLAPSPARLSGLDAVVVDLQDVGARYYTYLATLAMTMDACAAAGVPVIVADRPNPIGCSAVEGNLPRAHLKSFVSWLPLPNRHGLTAGEAARLHASTLPNLDLTVLPCEGLRRDMLWPDTGLPFVLPSPNIPTWETALVYPGMCLLEGTNLSEGRGTTMPFFLFGAPWITDPRRLVATLDAWRLPGVAFRPTYFTPNLDKWAGRRCGGAQLVVTDVHAFRPLLAGLAVLAAAIANHPDDFALRTEAYEFVHDRLAMDLLLGDEALRQDLLAGASPWDLAAAMGAETAAFDDARRPFLLVPD
jgi:uncharacterized protein YbbC (DUF1343 family)